MKKVVEKEVEFCDNCGSDDCVFNECIGCGKHFCYECNDKKKVGQKYSHAVYCSGSRDAYLCTDCILLPTPKIQEILEVYGKIANLRSESKVWYEDFEKRTKEAEAAVKVLAEKHSIK
jgi:hypothetical protein